MVAPDEKLESGPDAGTIIRLVVFVVVFVYAVVFVLSNSSHVEINFLFFTAKARVWLGFIAALVMGALLGLLVGWFLRRSKD